MRRVYLIGLRGSGKTTLGLALAARLGADFRDADQELERRLGRSIASFVAERGWEAFRDEESLVLAALARGEGEGTLVVSTGGGAVLREENRRLMRESGLCVLLEAPLAVLARRLEASPNASQRPSLTGGGLLEEMAAVAAERGPLYRAAAHLVLDASRPAEEVCASLLAHLEGWEPKGTWGPSFSEKKRGLA